MRYLLLGLLFVSLLGCKKKEANPELGDVYIEVTGAKKAKSHFQKGLLLLHSFEYEDAQTEFQKAQELDPTMAMAYWGEAMTCNKPLWSIQNFDEAKDIQDRMLEYANLESISEVEKCFVESLNYLYQSKTAKPERDKLYSDFLGQSYAKFPEEKELGAFYALSLLGAVPDGRDDKIYGQGAMVAQSILDDNKSHPGALHYLIHSYDDPEHAKLAYNAANAYAKVAPDASHALHMPSHIYVALGMWDKVISSNIDSYEASVTRMNKKELDDDARGYHAFHWLQYGYLQESQFDKAEQMVYDMQKYTKQTTSKRSRVHLVFLKGTYLVESGNWNSEIANVETDVSDLNIGIKGQNSFINGMLAFQEGKTDSLTSIISKLEKEIQKSALVVDNLDKGFAVCASVNRGLPKKSDVQQAEAMLMQLKAMEQWSTGDITKTEMFLKQSTEIENSLSFSYGPPFIQKPTSELYADWLLLQNRPAEALKYYNLTLEKATKRRLTLEGIEKSKAMIPDEIIEQKPEIARF
ncbi:MAG: hypothetical protein BM564_09480 [Bacteroidetes bacterium MedPE-SWsnd-G2]|nr:MAG: hypothetical protein BM564_09480 [Bacteroidetes bacterium MedPE-SWsnd-G2]